jgi:hypothetical protein
MKKAEARKIIENMGLPAPQERAARRTIARATASDEIDIVKRDSGQLVVIRSRPGRFGKQVLEDTIGPDGTKQVVQKAFDPSGQIVHFDPKGGTP